jgi:hypothetical protein
MRGRMFRVYFLKTSRGISPGVKRVGVRAFR